MPCTALCRPVSLLQEVAQKMKDEVKSWGFSFGREFPSVFDTDGVCMKIDVMERDEKLIVQADVPGMTEDDINLEMSSSSFKLTATQPCPAREEPGVRMWHAQRSCGKSTQEISLPFSVDPDQVTAVLEEGVLTVTAPKLEGTERHRVSISSYSSR